MGLDQYLTGRRFYHGIRSTDDEGHEIESMDVRLGYWRKHPNLHGFIVNNFGPKGEDGEPIDDCRDIELDVEALKAILAAVKDPKTHLPETTGFFFGSSSGDQEEIDDDIQQIEKAIAFLVAPAIKKEENVWRSVIYRASW